MLGGDFSNACSRNSPVNLEDTDLLVFLVAKAALKTREKNKLSNIQVMQNLFKSKDSLKQ